MSSHDKTWVIQRFPEYSESGTLIGVSYGCTELDLMGYTNISSLSLQMTYKIEELEREDLGR